MHDCCILDDERVILNMLDTESKAGALFGYMENQRVLLKPAFRSIVADWCIDVAMRYKLSQETIYLAIALLDGHLAVAAAPTKPGQLQLVAVTCLLIASKLEDTKPLTVTNVVAVCAKTYYRESIVAAEMLVLKSMNWSLHIPTAWNFLAWLVSCDGRTTSDIGLFAQYIVELVVIEYASLLLSASQIACTALCIARQHGRVKPILCGMAADTFMCTLIDVRPCALVIFDMLTACNSKLTAVQRKYKDGIFVLDGTWATLAHQTKRVWPPGDGDAGVLLQILEWGLFEHACACFSVNDIWKALFHARRR